MTHPPFFVFATPCEEVRIYLLFFVFAMILLEQTAHIEIESTCVAYEVIYPYIVVAGRAKLIILGHHTQGIEQVVGMLGLDDMPCGFGGETVARGMYRVEYVVYASLPKGKFSSIVGERGGIYQHRHTSQVEGVVIEHHAGIFLHHGTLLGGVVATSVERVERPLMRRLTIRIVILLESVAEIEVTILLGGDGGVAREVTLHQYRVIKGRLAIVHSLSYSLHVEGYNG